MHAALDGDVLAGSVVSQYQSLKMFMSQTNLDLSDAVKLSSENPAKQLGIYGRYGSLEVGKVANMIVMSSGLEVKDSYI